MQEQMTGAAMAMPADTNKAFKVQNSHLHSRAVNLRGLEAVCNLASPSIKQGNCSGFPFLKLELTTDEAYGSCPGSGRALIA